MATNKYTFEDSTAPTYEFKSSYHRGGRGRKNSYDDENGSLTYSAASSINSKESTDSSFAEIRRAFEAGGDSKEMAAFLKRHNMRADGSIAGESLAYSTDAESHLRYGGADSLAYSADTASYFNRSMATDLGSHLQGSDIVSGYVHLFFLVLVTFCAGEWIYVSILLSSDLTLLLSFQMYFAEQSTQCTTQRPICFSSGSFVC